MKYLDRVGNIIDKGDIIYCVDDRGFSLRKITVDKVYTVVESFTDRIDTVTIIDNNGNKSWFSKSRFVSLREIRDIKIDEILL